MIDLADLRIRSYWAKDHEQVCAMHIEGLVQYNSWSGDISLDVDLADIAGTYLAANGEFLIATIKGEIVAMGALRRVDDEIAEVKRMRVRPKYQNNGIGRLMLERLIEAAGKRGYHKLVLDTGIRQAGAQNLYLRRGFKRVGEAVIGGLQSYLYEMKLD